MGARQTLSFSLILFKGTPLVKIIQLCLAYIGGRGGGGRGVLDQMSFFMYVYTFPYPVNIE